MQWMKVLEVSLCWGDIWIEMKEYFELEENNSNGIWMSTSSGLETASI